jgi:thiamine transport system ATP-binding protein
MLTLENLTISVGDFRLSADLEVSDGAVVAVMGPSGAGKSTLLLAVAGFIEVQGQIMIAGQPVQTLPPAARPMSILFQDSNLFPHMTAFQNVALGVSSSMRLSADQTKAVQSALTRVGLQGLETRKPNALSGGQQSRVALARILVRNKPLVLLDEPFAALGPALKGEMLDLVAEIATERALTVLMVSHDPSDARRIAEQIILVADGKAHSPEETSTLLESPPEALRDYLGPYLIIFP